MSILHVTLFDALALIGGEGNTSLSLHEEYSPTTEAWRNLSENEISSTTFGTHGSALTAGGPAPGMHSPTKYKHLPFRKVLS